MKRLPFFIFLIFTLFAGSVAFARQVEIALSSNVEANKFTDEEIKKYSLSDQNYDKAGIIKKENEVTAKFQELVKFRYAEILRKLGKNNDVRFVDEYNPSTTNFILRIVFYITVDEVPLDVNIEGKKLKSGEYIHGLYVIHVMFQLEDPHSANNNEIVDLTPEYHYVYNSNEHLTADFLINDYWKFFMKNAVPKANADAMSSIIESFTLYAKASIKYKPLEGKKPKADGKQKGYVTVKIPEITGEAKKNSITRFLLKCEKGTFLETGTNQIEFSGAECYYENYGGKRVFKTKYKAYNCKDYEKSKRNYDIFTLIQKECMQKEVENTLLEKKVIFQCEKRYDVYAYYTAPKYVKAAVVWRNVTIRFPGEGQTPQELVYSPALENKSMDEIKGTDGKPLKIPFSMMLPGYGKRTLYGIPQNEYSTPEILYVTSLMKDVPFSVDLSHNALNSCEIIKMDNGPVYLDLSFDLYMGNLPEALQNTVRCWDPKVMKMMGHTLARYHFPTAYITEKDIENFKKFTKVEKTLSNGKATLRLEFIPEK